VGREAGSSASLRNDKQKKTGNEGTTAAAGAKAEADPYGMTNKRTDNGKSGVGGKKFNLCESTNQPVYSK
jgi:hypothetical protein